MTKSNVFKVIQDRYSVRRYAERPIEEEKLNLILESGRLAPSASNSQPWHFYVVKSRDKINALAAKMPLGETIVHNAFIAQAPVVIAATAGPISLLRRILSYVINKRWHYLDVAIALEHMTLTAWDIGIGSCWIGWFDEKKVKRLLDIPGDQEVIALLTLGYPKEDETPPEKHRKELAEIVDYR
jgi:nitroreductase